jgi:hypothetical protein
VYGANGKQHVLSICRQATNSDEQAKGARWACGCCHEVYSEPPAMRMLQGWKSTQKEWLFTNFKLVGWIGSYAETKFQCSLVLTETSLQWLGMSGGGADIGKCLPLTPGKTAHSFFSWHWHQCYYKKYLSRVMVRRIIRSAADLLRRIELSWESLPGEKSSILCNKKICRHDVYRVFDIFILGPLN